jgi:hypothetical protein
VFSGALAGAFVQAGYITGGVHIHIPPTPPSSGQTLTTPANRPWYFTIGWHMGNRFSLLPLPDDDHTSWNELVEALVGIGLMREEFDTVPITGGQLVNPPPPDQYGKNVAIKAYSEALSDLQQRVEERANRDELAWFLLGRLVVDIRTNRALDRWIAADPDGTESRNPCDSTHAAEVLLKGLAEEVKFPFVVATLLDHFLEALTNDTGVGELFSRSEELKYTCQVILRLSGGSD